MAVLLVAEDDVDVCGVLTMVFGRAGFTVVAAPDGVAALAAARRDRPDVVLTDLDMPRMTGLELCSAIRADPELADTPVAVLSGSLRPGDPRAAESHVCGVLLKPFSNAGLVAAVRQLAEHGPHGHAQVPSRCPLLAGVATG